MCSCRSRTVSCHSFTSPPGACTVLTGLLSGKEDSQFKQAISSPQIGTSSRSIYSEGPQRPQASRRVSDDATRCQQVLVHLLLHVLSSELSANADLKNHTTCRAIWQVLSYAVSGRDFLGRFLRRERSFVLVSREKSKIFLDTVADRRLSSTILSR